MSQCRQLPGTTNQRLLLLLFLLLAGNALPSEGLSEDPVPNAIPMQRILEGVALRQDTEAQVRLVNGSSHCSGRVEVLHDGQWGTICDDLWDLEDAVVVCRQLGCGAASEAPHSAHFGRGTGRIWLDDVQCTGEESALSQCPARPWGQSNCFHGEDAGVVCSGAAHDIRLVDGPDACSGRVEVLHDGQWGTICDDDWDITDAAVVCRQMGCGAASEAPGSARFGSGTGPIWRDDVACTGEESALSQCPASPWGQNNCYHGEDAGIVCSGLDEYPDPNHTYQERI